MQKQFVEGGAGNNSDEFWDAYVIAAVADMIAFAGTQSDKAHFLNKLRERFVPKTSAAPPNRSILPNPGIINFYGQLADSKLNSEDPAYSRDEISRDIDQNLDRVEEILRSALLINGKKTENAIDVSYGHDIWHQIDRVYRRNTILSLTLMLRLYNEASLSGEILDSREKKKWLDAYERIRDILFTLHKYTNANFHEEEIKNWLEARSEIYKEPYFVQEAAYWAALSAVMLGDSESGQTDIACPDAISLISVASSSDMERRVKESGDKSDRDIGRTRALITQIWARIMLSCDK